MAFFGVTIETIDTVRNHPGADRLDICTLEGMNFQFVTGRDSYKVGDRCLYFPVDSLLPFPLMKKLGLTKEKKENGEIVLDENGAPVIEGTLRGKNHNRLRVVRLRGELSQGLVGPLDLIEDIDPGDHLTEVITEFLGVMKYDPPDIPCENGNLCPLPSELTVYDIEGADRYSEVAEQLMDTKVCIAEKIEGTNFSCTYRPETDEFFVNQRGYTIVEKEGAKHMFWATVEKMGIFEHMRSVAKMFKTENFNSITFYGEFIGPGIQKNIYKLKEHTILFFDVKIDGDFASVHAKYDILNGLPIVPIIVKDMTLGEWLDGRPIQETSNGKSIFNPKIDILREGIVITPMLEGFHSSIGRLILKQRSSEYLINEK